MGSSPPKAAKAPNPNKLYSQGIKLQLQYLPQLLAAEASARSGYDPQRIQQQQALQDQYGPHQYQQQLDALHQLDPQGTAIREQLGKTVSDELALGGQLSPEMEQQLTSYIRGAETAHGNVLGAAPISAEGLFKGNAALQLFQQRQQNAGNFLNGPTPEQQLLTVQPVTPDRSSAYVNPNAGLQAQQFGLANYQNVLAQQQLSSGGRSPWASAAGGAASGALAGSSFGPYGAVIGGVAGGAIGYFSDERLKENVVNLFKDRQGIGRSVFSYKGDPTGSRYFGAIAQDVLSKRPDAVGMSDGFLTVSSEFAPVPV